MKSVGDIRIGCAMIHAHQTFWAILAHGVRERAQALELTIPIAAASHAADSGGGDRPVAPAPRRRN